MKDIVIQEYEIVDFVKGSPREVLRNAFECRLISDDDWMQMLRDRNDLTLDYDGAIVKDVCVRILSKYLGLFEDFETHAAVFYSIWMEYIRFVNSRSRYCLNLRYHIQTALTPSRNFFIIRKGWLVRSATWNLSFLEQ